MRLLIYAGLVLFLGWGSLTSAQAQEIDNSTPKSVSRLDSVSLPVKILRVIDGDTAEILYHDLFLKVRLADIDAPEIRGSQPFGRASARYLRKRIEGRQVLLKGQRKLDGFGRFLATIYTEDGTNINKEMIEKGYAWHYEKYSKRTSYQLLQKEAQREKRGLWQDPNPVAPWDYRKRP